MNRGELWQISFDPAIGGEIRKVRPALIISQDLLGVLPLRVVVPLTAWQSAFATYAWMVRLDPAPGNGLVKPSAADAFQLKSVSTNRFLKRLGSVSPTELSDVIAAVGVVIGHP